MSDNLNIGQNRQSRSNRPQDLPSLTGQEKAQLEVENTLLQFDRMIELIDQALQSKTPFRLQPQTIRELNGIALQRLDLKAGRWRDVPVEITHTEHVPPPPEPVEQYVEQMCRYVNEHWEQQTALHLAAYVLWQINWIHPFVDGNGRTARAIGYYVLCSKLGTQLPGGITIPELISRNKTPYYEALEAADAAFREARIDVSQMEQLLHNLLATQLLSVIKIASGDNNNLDESASMSPSNMRQKRNTLDRTTETLKSDAIRRTGTMFLGLTLLFFMALIFLSMVGYPVPEDARWLVVLVFALSGAFATALLGGNANARGTLPLPIAPQYSLRVALTGAIAALVILLIIGYYLFLSS